MRSVGDERHHRGGRGMGGGTLNDLRPPPLLEVVHRDSLDHNSLRGLNFDMGVSTCSVGPADLQLA